MLSALRSSLKRASPAQLEQLVGLQGRFFAAVAETFEKGPEPPLKLSDVYGVYASSLWSVGAKNSMLPKVEEDVQNVSAALDQSDSVMEFLSDPSRKLDEKKQFMDELMNDFGAEEVTTNFMRVVADNGRLSGLPNILQQFDRITAAARGEVEATVTSAGPLGDKERDEVHQALQAFLEPGQKLVLTEREDPAIMGGLVFEMGEKYIDCSIASRVKEIEKLIMSDD